MDWNNIFTLIGSYGFPIIMCLLLLFYVNKKDENHKTEIEQLKKAIDNNSDVLSRLIDKL